MTLLSPRGTCNNWSHVRVVSPKMTLFITILNLSGIKIPSFFAVQYLADYPTQVGIDLTFCTGHYQWHGVEELTSDSFVSQFDGRTTQMPSPIVPLSLMAFHPPAMSALVALDLPVVSFLFGYPQSQQLHLVS